MRDSERQVKGLDQRLKWIEEGLARKKIKLEEVIGVGRMPVLERSGLEESLELNEADLNFTKVTMTTSNFVHKFP